MFLANIFYYSKVIFKIEKLDTRLFHSRIFLYKIYYTYFKINGSLTLFKFCHSINKLVILFKFLKYLSLLVRQRQNVFLLHFISLSIFLTSSIESLGSLVFLIASSKIHYLLILFAKIHCVICYYFGYSC